MREEFIKGTDTRTDRQTELLPELLSELKRRVAKKTLEVAALLCWVIEELHPKLIMLAYSLLSLLIKHAMILNILRRYQLSPPPGLDW